jgi:nicotinate-nucleotide--dimethylbenzimidazole phosphoribosyltransferase
MAAARARGGGDLAVWLAGVTGAQPAVVSVRTIDASTVVPARGSAAEPLAVAEVAHAVDAGRDLSGAAAADGMTLVAARSADTADPAPAVALSDALAARHREAIRGPLHALRTLGTAEIAVLCGVALGAGEHGLGCLCDGLAALAGAAVAAAVEPALLRRLLAVGHHEHAALLGLAAVDPRDLHAVLG